MGKFYYWSYETKTEIYYFNLTTGLIKEYNTYQNNEKFYKFFNIKVINLFNDYNWILKSLSKFN